MQAIGRRTVLQVMLIVVLAAVLRVVVLELDKIDCGGAPYKQFEFTCDMGFFVLHVLLITAFLGAVIPFITLADRRDRIAGVWQFLLIPGVVNALLRGVDFMLFDCEGDGYVSNETVCVVLFAQVLFLSLPTLAAIIFVWLKGWKLLFLQEKEGVAV